MKRNEIDVHPVEETSSGESCPVTQERDWSVVRRRARPLEPVECDARRERRLREIDATRDAPPAERGRVGEPRLPEVRAALERYTVERGIAAERGAVEL